MTQSTSPVGPDGVVRCYHNVELSVLTSTSANNPGRKFYTCFKKRGDPDKCNFFKWADELLSSSQGAAVPGVSQPETPSKRSRVVTPPRSNFSPSKTVTKLSRDRSDRIENVGDFVNPESDEEISQFLSRRSPDEPPAKKYRFQTNETSGHNAMSRSSSGTTYLPISPTKTPPGKTSQWQAIHDDPENPFHDHATSIAQTRSLGPPLSRPSPSTFVVTGDSIKQAWGFWSAIPEAYCKLERKLIAAEKARDSKAARIARLEKEVQDLKDRNLSLEGAMEALKASR